MFERYTEKARRTIFFARYEASQFGSSYIETEYLLLGLLRENKELVNQFLGSHAAVEAIRAQIASHTPPREKVATSLDLPLSTACKRVLAYGAEESDRLNHRFIGSGHLLLGLLREEECFAAKLLRERGVTLASAREVVQQSDAAAVPLGESAAFARLDEWLAEREARGGIWAVKQEGSGKRTIHVEIYAGDPPKENEEGLEMAPAEKAAHILKRIRLIVDQMERAIANHEFVKARVYSDEERKEHENLRTLREQFNLEEPPSLVPILCIDVIRGEPLSAVQKRCDNYIAEGVVLVWLLEPELKRAYTVTKTEGLREFKREILRVADPLLEMDLSRVFN
jgi:ClpA/ClpB-like protein